MAFIEIVELVQSRCKKYDKYKVAVFCDPKVWRKVCSEKFSRYLSEDEQVYEIAYSPNQTEVLYANGSCIIFLPNGTGRRGLRANAVVGVEVGTESFAFNFLRGYSMVIIPHPCINDGESIIQCLADETEFDFAWYYNDKEEPLFQKSIELDLFLDSFRII